MRLNRRTFVLAAGAAGALSAQMNLQRKLRIAIVGAGHRAWAHIQVLKALPEFEILALADPTPQNLDHSASLIGAKTATYADYHKMLAEHPDLDGVIVITPNFVHAEVAVAALSKGINVLCE